MTSELHPLLLRQLRKFGLDVSLTPDVEAWQKLLQAVDGVYHDADQDRYTLERSLAVSSDEMQALYQRQKTSYEARLRTIFGSLNDLIWFKDANGAYLACNPVFERFIGLSEAQIVGKTDDDLVDRETADFLQACDRQIMSSRKSSFHEYRGRPGLDGQQALFEIVMTPILDTTGQVTGLLGLGRDITARKLADNRIRDLAFFDQLTGLPNRTLLLDRLKQAMTASLRRGNYSALLFIDLDHFKMLNDTLGHDMGDRLLRQVAQRLLACVRKSDTVARLGGDEFVVILDNLSPNETEAATQTEAIGAKILASLNQAYLLGDVTHHSTPSVGATLYKGHQTSIDGLLKQADLAMYKSKEAGRNTLRFFDPEMEIAVLQRVGLEQDLREALLKNQFLVYYQAQVDGESRVTGAEVLVRWQHPERGLVSPADFIPLAEDTGLILPLGQWVLESACSQLAQWAMDPALAHLTLSVNVSAFQFRNPDFLDQVFTTLQRTGADPFKLKLELTESLLIFDIEGVIQKMLLLKSRGIGFMLDDFGTGYSSLSYLKRMPLEHLKIDQSFVRDMLTDPNDASIVMTIIALAHNLGKGVIAEGVENEPQKDFLANAGCRLFQGYLIARPLPVSQFETFVQCKALAQRVSMIA
ncbi:MAG: hypothetical protein RL211_1073 [Pseudomonadota bacterium]